MSLLTKITSKALFTLTVATVATASHAAPVTFSFTGTVNNGSVYDYSTRQSSSAVGYTFEIEISGDDEAAPDYTYSNSYGGYYSYDQARFTLQAEVNIFDTAGSLVETSGQFDTQLAIVDYLAGTQSRYDEYANFNSYYETSSTGKYVELYLQLRGDGPDSLFQDGDQYDSLTSLDGLTVDQFVSPSFSYSGYDSNTSGYFRGAITGTQLTNVAPANISAVPLPAGALLMLTGLGAFGISRRIKSKS